MSFDWSSFGSAIIGAITGGLITGYFALRSTKDAHDNQMKQVAKMKTS